MSPLPLRARLAWCPAAGEGARGEGSGGVRAAGRGGAAWRVAKVAAAAAEDAAAEAAAAAPPERPRAAGRAAPPALLALRPLRCDAASAPERMFHFFFHFYLVRSPNAVPARRAGEWRGGDADGVLGDGALARRGGRGA